VFLLFLLFDLLDVMSVIECCLDHRRIFCHTSYEQSPCTC